MNCPNCNAPNNQRTTDSRPSTNSIRRRRICLSCEFRWTTYEIPAAVFAEMKAQAGDHLRAALMPMLEEIYALCEPPQEPRQLDHAKRHFLGGRAKPSRTEKKAKRP